MGASLGGLIHEKQVKRSISKFKPRYYDDNGTGLNIHRITQPHEKSYMTLIEWINSHCGKAMITPNQMLFASVSIARVTGFMNMITSANRKNKFNVLMNRTDRTNDRHVLNVHKH